MTPREQSGTGTPARRDHRQEVTDSIIKMLEDGVAPWQKPWESAGMPFNPTTDKGYRGGNAVHLMATGLSRGYEDPRWMTYKQAAENGWQVRKGEKGTHIEFWEVKAKREEKSAEPVRGGRDETAKENQSRFIHRVYTVFNAKQVEGVPALEREQLSAFEAVHSGERILANSGAKIAHDQRDSAFYSRSSDSIHLPLKETFKDAPGYYGTALHELAHWTGHPSRLNRPTLNDSYRFGDLNYAKEELRAELASVFIAAEVGVPHDPANHAAYVGSWIKALKEDKNEIFRAAHDASAATDFVLSLEREVSRAEALEAGNPAVTDIDKAQALRDETGVLENDRDLVASAYRDLPAGAAQKDGGQGEDTRFVARFEPQTGTVAVHDKRLGTDNHTPVEALTAPEKASPDGWSPSFAAATNITAEKLGDAARTFPAQTQSGNYRGEIIGETELHVVQRLSPQTAIAHLKHLLQSVPRVGDNVGIGYRNPEGGAWETADRYLSGNVRTKLIAAQDSARLDPAYQRNVEALQAVQPPDLEPGEIEARLGSSWIPRSDIRAFVAELLDVPPANVKVGHAESIATWTLELDHAAKYTVSNTTTHGTSRFRASDLVEQSLNGRTPTAYDEDPEGNRTVNQPETIAAREKQQQLKDRFGEWVWEDPSRAKRLADDYNFRFNNIRLRDFDGSHLTLPGMVRTSLRDGDLAPHQKNAVWRILQGGSPLLAHVVGAGKTWTMTAAAMELRRLDLAKKPMLVVPNHLVDQWGGEFLKLYPQARLFVAGKEHFATENRQQAMARIATGNYDAVIVSHRSFELLPVSDEYFNRFVQKQVAELDDEIGQVKESKDDNRRIVKELEKAKKRLTVRLKKRAARETKDRVLTFEELGIDACFVDEADLYKNLAYTTKMNRIAGLPNSDSNRAFDMFLKARYLQERSDGRGVVFATGTPISNTLAEMYTMLRYLGPEMLSERGVNHFDPWAANFAEAVTSLELAPDGSGYRMHTRFAKFINLPELLTMFRTVADVQTADMLNLPRPTLENGRPAIVAAPASPELKAFIRTLTERAERLKKERVDPAVDNMLKITGEGRKAALDMRLVQPGTEPQQETKVDYAVSRIHKIWNDTRNERSTQLVFSDLSTPNPERFNVYEDVRTKLVTAGIPPREIAFIHDAETDTAKKNLFDGVNAGRVRILLGSTEKMGAGTNVQRRLVALHHLDAPWRPRDIEQREGRILRQGNTNKEVQIYRYVTEGSFDAYMWQCLETKARFIHQVMRGETSVRAAEDLDSGALTYAEIKAIASGNPAVVEKIRIDTEIRKLDQLRAVHANQQRHIRWEIRGLPRYITETKQRLADIEGDIGLRDGTDAAEFSMAVGNHVFSGKGAREEAAKALTFAVMTWRDDQTIQPRGKFRGFEILSKGKSGGFGLLQEDDRVPELFVRGRATYSANLNPANPVGTVQSIEYTLRSLDKLAAEQQGRMARAEKELVDYQAQADRPFEHEDRLKLLLLRQSELNSQLDLDKGDQQAADSAPETNEDLERDKIAAAAVPSPSDVAKMAEAYMRAAGTAIREMPILQRTPPETGSVTGRAVAKDEAHVAVATAANRFIVVEATTLSRDIQIGERLSLLFSKGRASLDNDRSLER